MNNTFVNFRKSRENWNRSVVLQFFAGFFLVDWMNIFTFSGNHLFKIWWLRMFAICESITFAAIFDSLSGMLSALAPVAFIWCTGFVILLVSSMEALGKLKSSGSLYLPVHLLYVGDYYVQKYSFYSTWIIFSFRILYTTTPDGASTAVHESFSGSRSPIPRHLMKLQLQ